MKFTHAWADIASQNVTLKAAIFCLFICVIALGITTTKLGLKNPIVIERGCNSKILTQGTSERTKAEIEAFIKESIPRRFDSTSQMTPGFFDNAEESAHDREQKEFSSREMTQKIIINSVKITGDQISVDADRLISVGDIRSAFRFPLTVSVASVSRSEGNPYGLFVTKVTQAKEESANGKK